MHLGIDAREIQNGITTGIGRALVNFLYYFDSLNNNDICVLFTEKPVHFKFSHRVKNSVINPCTQLVWDQIQLPQAIKKENISLFYSPYYKIPLATKAKCINAVLDIMYLKFEPYQRELSFFKKMYYATFERQCLKKADKILTCSEYSKNDIIREFGIKEEKIEVIPLSVSKMYYRENDQEKRENIKHKYGIKGPFILYVGNLKPHKNIDNILQGFKLLSNEFNDLTLVIAGPKTYTYKKCLELIHTLALKEKVIFTGIINEGDQPHILYSAAEAFVMPSFYEGFGLPPVEAMACGTPVVVSNATSIPEVVKDAGLLVDPQSPMKIANALKSILVDSNLKKSLIEKGFNRVKEFEETKISKKMYDFFLRANANS